MAAASPTSRASAATSWSRSRSTCRPRIPSSRRSSSAGRAAATPARRSECDPGRATRDVSPQSPEARRKRLVSMEAAFGHDVVEKLKPRHHAWEVLKRVSVGVYNDGFIHAGNLAYLALLA